MREVTAEPRVPKAATSKSYDIVDLAYIISIIYKSTERKWRVASEDEDSESELDTPQQPSKFKGGAEIVHKTGVASKFLVCDYCFIYLIFKYVEQKRNVTSVDSESELDTSPGPVQVSRSKPCRGIVMSKLSHIHYYHRVF